MATRTGTFTGASVFLSRSLVPPEVFDALHDALRLNGAQVFLCSDPSRNSLNEYHVISSIDHEKFDDLRSKGCNLLGPQCILSCAKERRVLPKQGYTCCLAMDGVKVLASGFESDEKATIEKLVTAMGGVLYSKASLDVDFVIVKNVRTPKYKWALNVLKKPMVKMSWLQQCWTEHRVVPQEPHRILPFTGLSICITRIPADGRKELEKLIVQNGGHYTADLTKKCTHLVSDAPIGDKYMVARRWGHIHIVTRKWIDLSIAKRACLDEGCYPVRGTSTLSNDTKDSQKEQRYPDSSTTTSQPALPTIMDDLEATLSQNISSSFSDATKTKIDATVAPELLINNESNIDSRVADDSEGEDDDLYLSNCRILLVGFQEKEMSKLVSMIRKGGGSRHMMLSERLTHIIVGAPSESEKKEVRRLAALGVIYVVKATWLEECDRTKKELSVSPRHNVTEILLSKDSVNSAFPCVPVVPMGQATGNKKVEAGSTVEKKRDNNESKSTSKVQSSSGTRYSQHGGQSNTFKGRSFCFSSLFPVERRAEVIEWVKQGGGVLVNDKDRRNANFIIERHGILQIPADLSQFTIVSSHWVRSSLEAGCMQDIDSHILYSPLRCHIPLPGFEGFRFCISQYEEKERILLKNLCYTLGAKFTERLSKKVTHLLCKFTSGSKYEAACKWEIKSVTADWITECITQDTIVALDPFRPRPATSQDREAGLCTQSQHPTQAARMVSGNLPSQMLRDSQGPVDNPEHNTGFSEEALNSRETGIRSRVSECDIGEDASKKRRKADDLMGAADVRTVSEYLSSQMLVDSQGPVDNPELETGNFKKALRSRANGKRSRLLDCDIGDGTSKRKSKVNDLVRGTDADIGVVEATGVVEAIDFLIAQSNEVQETKSPERPGDQIIFSPDHSILGHNHASSHSAFATSRHWLSRTEKQDTNVNPAGQDRHPVSYDAFSETQTESQVVGYEEDLSGRQKIIDRVRSQSMTLTPDK